MNRQDYANPIGNQVRSLPELVDIQLDRCFDKEVLQDLITVAEIFDVRKIYVTGAGDSIAAAGAMADVMMEYAGVFGCEAVEPVEFCRFMKAGDIGIGEPNSPLVIAISAGGGTARVAEALQKTNELGAMSMLLTNKQESRCSQVAKKVFYLNTPPMKNDMPGLRSYFASMIGLIAVAVRLGHVRNVTGPEKAEEVKEAISSYVHRYEEVMEQIEEQMFALAQTWKDFERFDFIGSGRELASAMFSADKFYECNGVISNYDDAEDWCHIDYFLKNPETVGTVVFADKNAPDFGRTKETIAAAAGINRPVLVITNAKRSEFCENVTVCTVPEAPEGYEWLLPLMDFAPAAILSGYCSAVGGRRFFNMFDAVTGEKTGEGRFFDKELMTLGTSKIEIHI